jgi:uncharacterized protein
VISKVNNKSKYSAQLVKGFFLLASLLWIMSFPLLSKAKSTIPARPDPPHLVNDFAQLLNQSESETLEQKLIEYEKKTSTQIAIVTIESLEEEEIADYATQLGHEWGIGQKDKGNGVVLLVSKGDRKMFIATGYGTETILTDAVCKRIIEQDLIPNFKQGNYNAGLNQAFAHISGLLDGSFKADSLNTSQSTKIRIDPLSLIFLFFILVQFLSSIFGKNNKTYGRRGGLADSIFWGSALGSSWGSGSSSSFKDFSGGGGSFGGFGGGDFGGGGAGGSW